MYIYIYRDREIERDRERDRERDIARRLRFKPGGSDSSLEAQISSHDQDVFRLAYVAYVACVRLIFYKNRRIWSEEL